MVCLVGVLAPFLLWLSVHYGKDKDPISLTEKDKKVIIRRYNWSVVVFIMFVSLNFILHIIFSMKYWVLSKKIKSIMENKEDFKLEWQAKLIFGGLLILNLISGITAIFEFTCFPDGE